MVSTNLRSYLQADSLITSIMLETDLEKLKLSTMASQLVEQWHESSARLLCLLYPRQTEFITSNIILIQEPQDSPVNLPCESLSLKKPISLWPNLIINKYFLFLRQKICLLIISIILSQFVQDQEKRSFLFLLPHDNLSRLRGKNIYTVAVFQYYCYVVY